MFPWVKVLSLLTLILGTCYLLESGVLWSIELHRQHDWKWLVTLFCPERIIIICKTFLRKYRLLNCQLFDQMTYTTVLFGKYKYPMVYSWTFNVMSYEYRWRNRYPLIHISILLLWMSICTCVCARSCSVESGLSELWCVPYRHRTGLAPITTDVCFCLMGAKSSLAPPPPCHHPHRPANTYTVNKHRINYYNR